MNGIWGESCTLTPEGDWLVDDSPRTGGGRYTFSEVAGHLFNNESPPDLPICSTPAFKAKLTTWLIEQRRQGDPCPKISADVLKEVEQRPALSVAERGDRLLLYIASRLNNVSDSLAIIFNVDEEIKVINEILACLEAHETKDVIYFLDYLVKRQLITKIREFLGGSYISITPEGYAYLDGLSKKKVDSEQAFVAMWFDPSMDGVYEQAIDPAIWDAGYRPLRIDKKDHNNKIDDQIVAEIKRSRFLIADFTHGDKGMRGGVYYEAGLAHGLGLPVIFTCRKDMIEDLHFDTRQYNHIGWETNELDAFRTALSNRISATIGDGPRRKKHPKRTESRER